MSKKMLIDATHAEETRVVVVDGNKVEEFDFETVNKRQLAGNIYLAKVTRVEPSLQAAFVEYGGNRHGFLAFAEIHPDYYQIPVADRKALLDEERAFNRAQDEEDNRRSRPRPKPQQQQRPRAESVDGDAVQSSAMSSMDVVDLGEETGADALVQSVPADVVEQPHHDHDHHDHSHTHHVASVDAEEAEPVYRSIDHASDTDDEIESIADEDVSEEISAPRKPRARRYKIQEVIKVRQIMLVQVVKEERGNKGAALTTYLSLAGRYCVLMPNTARGGGISRKITQAADRKKLKEIATEIEVPEGAGLIIRTAGAKRTKPEIKRDYEYLMRLWEQIRELTLKSIAPAAIYEEGNLIKRTIRDLYSREIDEILVEGEAGYRTAKDFMRMIMPSHAKSVVRYDDPTPLFAKYQVESYLGGMFNPTVQLKSGGYIVIGITEALVAVDVNSGRATKEGSIEDTALKTNLEAAEEVARQLRLRDLAGLIVIDFIDMEERRNNAAVEKKLKDKLKTDRARIQVGRISGFGLMEMSRQRLRPGMLESTTQPCSHCHGTGLIRSDDSLGLQVLRALEEEGTRKRSKEVLLRAPIGIVNFLINGKREHIALIEARYGMSVRIECDPAMITPDFSIEKFKTATRVVPEISSVISGNASLMGAPVAEEDDEDIIDDVDDVEEAEVVESTAVAAAATAPAAANGDGGTGKKRRRRRRRKKPGQPGEAIAGADAEADDGDDDGDDEAGDDAPEVVSAVAATEAPVEVAVKKPTRTRAPRGSKSAVALAAAEAPAAEVVKPASSRSRSRTVKVEPVADVAVEVVVVEAPVVAEEKPKATRSRTSRAKPKAEVVVEAVALEAPTSVAVMAVAETAQVPSAPVLQADPGLVEAARVASLHVDPGLADAAVEPAEDDGPAKPKKRGWWSLGR
ncbi:ribonuclease E/G [Cypionkella sp.]|uniref:Rne/Rng family ribonuclease n=1 Tax=Cypionkella sp. TaxID=2811411 RepID=UPI002728525C|nr:ribonuclease E/G [Cypionkella sp.]MDO8984314.1 ribonuclease E/G [Cypionkella sp.]MDP2047988.1 ribonuclease E/G [Cypionkella sp.]